MGKKFKAIRTFNGKRYKFGASFRKKTNARKTAEKAKKIGEITHYRIVKGKYGYNVYFRG